MLAFVLLLLKNHIAEIEECLSYKAQLAHYLLVVEFFA
jgi:hypothetical protein